MEKRTSRNLLLAAITLLTVFGLTDALLQEYLVERYRAQQVDEVQNGAGEIRAQLETMLASDLLMIRSTAAYISVHPDLATDDFDRFASEIIANNDTLANLAAAPGLVIDYVYPYEGNESIVGVDYRDLPEQLPLVLRARDTGSVVIAGPISVLQGGQGIIARAPVFVTSEMDRRFWGIVSSLINFDRMTGKLEPILEENGMILAIRGANGTGADGPVFHGDPELFEDPRSILRDVTFPNGSWQIAVAPVTGWSIRHPSWMVVHIVFLLGALGTIGLVYRKTLNELLVRRNEERLRDITMASSDIVWEADTSYRFTYAAGHVKEILGYDASSLLGRSFFEIVVAEERERVDRELRRMMENGESVTDYQIWATGDAGRQVCFLVTAVPQRERGSDRVIGYRGVHKDITIRQRLREEADRSAGLLDLFFGQSLDGFFFMMLDEPVMWRDATDKDALLEWIFDHQRITKVNHAMVDQYRTSESDFIGLTLRDFFAHDVEAGKAIWRDLFDNERLHVNTDERRFDGSVMAIEGDYILITDPQGRVTGHFGVQRDVTAMRVAETKLNRYVDIVDENVITSQTDLDGTIIYASAAFCEISGYSKEELIGQTHNIVRHPDMDDALFKDLWETITAGQTWHGEIKNLKKDGGYYWVDTDVCVLVDRSGAVYGYMAVRQNITDRKELEVVSVTDRLTALFNRQKLDQTLEEQSDRFRRYKENYTLIIFDIDHFKSINDTYGHLEGDRILQTIAGTILPQVRQTDIVGRWGGEEFLIVCPHTDLKGGITRAEELRGTIRAYDFGLDRPVTASFGVADIQNCPSDGNLTFELLKAVDQALYTAKEAGRDCVRATHPASPPSD